MRIWISRLALSVALLALAGPMTLAEEAARADWTLTDHRGKAVNARDLDGRFTLMVFGYTFCPDVCPTSLGEVATVMAELGEAARYVVPVFVTIDPERDTPAVLADYVAHFDPRLIGLTGGEQQIKALRQAFGVISLPGPKAADGSYFISHSADKYLIGPDGTLVASFDPEAGPGVVASYILDLFRRMGV